MHNTDLKKSYRRICIELYTITRSLRAENDFANYSHFVKMLRRNMELFNQPTSDNHKSQFDYKVNFKAMLIDLLVNRDKWPPDNAGLRANRLVHPGV